MFCGFPNFFFGVKLHENNFDKLQKIFVMIAEGYHTGIDQPPSINWEVKEGQIPEGRLANWNTQILRMLKATVATLSLTGNAETKV